MKLITLTGQLKTGYNKLCGLNVKFANGRAKGQPLYKLPELQRNLKWDYRDANNYLVTCEYDIPEETQIEIYGFCRIGKERVYWRRIYNLDNLAEVLAVNIELPLYTFFVKGRLTLVADLRSGEPIDYEGGF